MADTGTNAYLAARRATRYALLVSVSALCACSSTRPPQHPLTAQVNPVSIGTTEVRIVVHDSGRPGLTFVNLHDDENTSVQAALELVPRQGGRLIELQHTGERNVVFELGAQRFAFDPNRMFSEQGAEASLANLGAASPEALAAVRSFADRVLEFYNLADVDVLVALHNNTDLNYSLNSYTDGGVYSSDASAAHRADGADPDDFFFVTETSLYERLKASGYNVVLQDNERVTEDGSLSVYCGKNGIGYVNVEAEHGHVRTQVEMIALLTRILDSAK